MSCKKTNSHQGCQRKEPEVEIANIANIADFDIFAHEEGRYQMPRQRRNWKGNSRFVRLWKSSTLIIQNIS